MALPSNVGHGTVTGRFIDSSGTNIEGKVKFTPTPKRLLNASADPSPVTILPKAVEVTLNDGAFTQALLATDDPDNNPTGWNYRVDFSFNGSSAESFNIEVPEGSSVDLTTVTPVSSGNGTLILRGQGVPDWADATDGDALVIVAGEPSWGEGGAGPADWSTLSGKPAVIAAGETQAEARAAIGAGTSSLAIGTTGSTAAAGNDARLSDARTPLSHTHDAADIASGTLAFARIPTGTTGSSVAVGNHTHAATAITSGTLDEARIPTLAQSKVTGLTAALATIGTIATLPAGATARCLWNGTGWTFVGSVVTARPVPSGVHLEFVGGAETDVPAWAADGDTQLVTAV